MFARDTARCPMRTGALCSGYDPSREAAPAGKYSASECAKAKHREVGGTANNHLVSRSRVGALYPVADLYGTDVVVRHPVTRELLAIQVKHKQPGSLNEGELLRTWDEHKPSFDYLVFFVPARLRGLIIPRQRLQKSGKMFIFYSRDEEGYARGAVRPTFKGYAFEFRDVMPESRAIAFADFFAKVHAENRSEDSVGIAT